MNNSAIDFKFSIRLIAWCQEHGVDDELAITVLLNLIQEFYISKTALPKKNLEDLKEIRLSKGLTAKQVSIATGLSTVTVYNQENYPRGGRNPYRIKLLAYYASL